MAIPNNISREHILRAIEEIDKNGIPRDRQQQKFNLKYRGKNYPPKYAISLANIYANGDELKPSVFSGGDETNPFLRSRGFEVEDFSKIPVDDRPLYEHTDDDDQDYALKLKGHLEARYSIKIEKISRTNLRLPSGTIVHAKGSKNHGKSSQGSRYWFGIDKNIYNDLIQLPSPYLSLCLSEPGYTFVLPKQKIKEIFDNEPTITRPNGNTERWLFHIIEKDQRHFITIHGANKYHDIEDYLNQWDQIDDFNGKLHTSYAVYVTGYPAENLETSKRVRILGWKKQSRGLSAGDKVFVYNLTTKEIETCFRILSPKPPLEPVWKDELDTNGILYKNRWNAEIVYDGLKINMPFLKTISPFDKEPFPGLVRGDFPVSLNFPEKKSKYSEFVRILESINDKNSDLYDNSIEEFDDGNLAFPKESAIEEGIYKIKEKYLIDENILRNIIVSLVSGKNILLSGPVGTGKTSLSREISQIFWKSEDNEGYYADIFTATSEWTTQDVIGGIMPRMDRGGIKYGIVNGCVSETVLSNWSKGSGRRTNFNHENKKYRGVWLVIDEFNRADIDKVFGQLFTSLESRILKIPSIEDERGYRNISIPRDYRIIGTLNTADKHYLFKLSDALKRRFSFIEIFPPERHKKDLEIYYALRNAILEVDMDFGDMLTLDEQAKSVDSGRSKDELLSAIDQAYYILDFIRITKPLGTGILKSIFQTLLVGIKLTNDHKESLAFALTSNLLPQLENLRSTTLEVIINFLFKEETKDIIDFFKNKYDGNEREQYVDGFRSFIAFLESAKPEKKIESFIFQKMEEDQWASITKSLSEKKILVNAPSFENSLKDLMKSSVI